MAPSFSAIYTPRGSSRLFVFQVLSSRTGRINEKSHSESAVIFDKTHSPKDLRGCSFVRADETPNFIKVNINRKSSTSISPVLTALCVFKRVARHSFVFLRSFCQSSRLIGQIDREKPLTTLWFSSSFQSVQIFSLFFKLRVWIIDYGQCLRRLSSDLVNSFVWF